MIQVIKILLCAFVAESGYWRTTSPAWGSFVPSSSSPWVSSSASHCDRDGVPTVAPPLARWTKPQLKHTHLHKHNADFLCLSFCYLFLILHIAVATMLCTTNNQDITMIWDFIRGSCRKLLLLLLLLLHLLVEDIVYSIICKCRAVISAFTKHWVFIGDSISHDFLCRFSSVTQRSERIPSCFVKLESNKAHVVFFPVAWGFYPFIFVFSGTLHMFIWLTLCLVN